MKTNIIEMGSFDENGELQGWCFDCYQIVSAIEVGDGRTLYGGYSISELVEIAEATRR